MFVKKIKKVTERTDSILDILSIEYIQQAFTHASRIFPVSVYYKWTNMHDDDNERK